MSIAIPAFMRLLRVHTFEAKRRWGALDRWGAGSGWSKAEIGMAVMVEEVGKAARCINKLHIVEDAEVAAHWRRELGHRLLTTASVAMRLAEQFADAPTATVESNAGGARPMEDA